MKSIILKTILPPFFLIILYMNLNFFVFSFEARRGYLNKRLKSSEKDVTETERQIKSLKNDKRMITHSELSQKLKEAQEVSQSTTNDTFSKVDIYREFEKHNLILLSEESEKLGIDQKGEIDNLTKYMLSGDYIDVIKALQALSKSELIPVSFSLTASGNGNTRYSISVWNKNE